MVKYVLYLLLFLIPSQLAFHFWPSQAFVFGIRVDYLSPAIYLTDILILATLYYWGLPKNKYIKYLVFFALVNTLLSTNLLISLVKWIKILFLTIFAISISQHKKELGQKEISYVLYFSAIFFSLIGIIQVFLGGTIGGLFYFLGERTFTMQTPGIALFNIGGSEILRAYSTFSHPNSFAGYLGVVLLFLIIGKYFKKLPYKAVGISIISVAFLLTFSMSAFISFIGAFLIYPIIKKRPLFLIGAIVLFSFYTTTLSSYNSEKISERIKLSRVALKNFTQNPIFGSGLNTFIPNASTFKLDNKFIWNLQPVHNIYLLTLSELGIFGLFLFFMIINKSIINLPLIFILITGLFDHYSLTLQQNMLILTFVLGMLHW